MTDQKYNCRTEIDSNQNRIRPDLQQIQAKNRKEIEQYSGNRKVIQEIEQKYNRKGQSDVPQNYFPTKSQLDIVNTNIQQKQSRFRQESHREQPRNAKKFINCVSCPIV